jgi:hypothetical protein
MRIIGALKIPQNIHRGLEQRSNEKGQELADAMLSSTSRGRGLWLLLLLPAWFMVFAVGTSVAHVYLDMPYWAAAIAGLVCSSFWWKLEFTREHPFWSSMLAYVGLPMLLVMLGK